MSNIASKPGKHTNFTGSIWHKDITCAVKNANFELYPEYKSFKGKIDILMVFYSGVIVNGYDLKNTIIKHCTFQGDELYDSVFYDGLFKGKKFRNSYWYGGEWHGKEWLHSYDKFGRKRAFPPTEWESKRNHKTKGIANTQGIYRGFTGTIKWKKADFVVRNSDFELVDSNKEYDIFVQGGEIVSGDIKHANIVDSIAKGGNYHHCFWRGGLWEDGKWHHGIWEDGIWEGGDWHSSEWHGGVWKDGWWFSGWWRGGDWYNGTFRAGTWDWGTWHGGTWLGGNWLVGNDKNGGHHTFNDSPNKWNI